MTVTYELLILLFIVAFLAGSFDAIAGGGGLITLPALLLAGLPPVDAIATNKLQTTFGSTSASIAFARRGLMTWRTALPYAALAFAGSIGGALSVKYVPRSVLEAAVPIMLIVIAVYFALKRGLSDGDAQAKMSLLWFAPVPAFIGFYDGIFGPGAGSFYMVGFVSLLGFGVIKATAHTKLANAGSNWGSLLVFIVIGSIWWSVGLVMGVGSFLGAQVGSRLAMRLGARLIRPLLVTICCILAIRLLWNSDNPVRVLFAQLFLG